ncbi:DUF6538 domain-containing protein [Aliiruegeria lutimaris]|uniref:DUF6538 domain-containing protein n=1 Tax=Aliiruegeria lutimaris TaxID=571298 RepID=A0A1G9A7C8_9RHOB|nr:DUF6538 domain-containing protein [Aliiruegeria lutimaris]SDK22525.1 hypothetical protein SAMN04488026_103439 [Aliiruegeria lutimaris]
MAALEKMPGHPRLYRRKSTLYHRAAIPRDISETYPKSEETFSLRTNEHGEAVRRVRIAAVGVDQRFGKHRQWLATARSAPLDELPEDQINLMKKAYVHYLLDEDDEVRLEGFMEQEDRSTTFGGLSIFEAVDEALKDTRGMFEERSETVDAMREGTAAG